LVATFGSPAWKFWVPAIDKVAEQAVADKAAADKAVADKAAADKAAADKAAADKAAADKAAADKAAADKAAADKAAADEAAADKAAADKAASLSSLRTTRHRLPGERIEGSPRISTTAPVSNDPLASILTDDHQNTTGTSALVMHDAVVLTSDDVEAKPVGALSAGSPVTTLPSDTPGWRKVKLNDGSVGYVRDEAFR
jgi:hypothetical protein